MAKGLLLGNNNSVLFEDAQARADLDSKIQLMTESAWNALSDETKAVYATKKVLTLITTDPEPETNNSNDNSGNDSSGNNDSGNDNSGDSNSDPDTSSGD